MRNAGEIGLTIEMLLVIVRSVFCSVNKNVVFLFFLLFSVKNGDVS